MDRDIGDPNFLHRCNQGASLARMPAEDAFALKCGKVLHHRSLARKPKMPLNLARARCDAFSALLALDEIENVFLTMRQHTL